YSRQTLDTANPVARYAHRQRHRLSLDRAAAEVPEGGTVLDYGCGEGTFLNALAEARPDVTLLGYDPESGPVPHRHPPVADMAAGGGGAVDVLCSLEPLEPLYDPEIAGFAADAARVLRPGGLLL